MLLKTGKEYTIPDDLHEELIESYGDVMFKAECEAMRMWLFTNKPKRKTESGMPKFINSWLARTKKTGGVSPFVVKHEPPSGSGEVSIRSRPFDASISDISWLEGEQREIQKQYYLTTRGFYFDGGNEVKYA
tara:strand:+ start:405 stop:800 length:396 start_codon:yes stop_codon:yes gene_type:complete